MGEFVYKRQEQLGVKLETWEEFGSEMEDGTPEGMGHLRGWDTRGDGQDGTPEGLEYLRGGDTWGDGRPEGMEGWDTRARCGSGALRGPSALCH